MATDALSTLFRHVSDPQKSKAPETLGISGAWQGDLERAKGIEPFRQEYRCIAMCCDMANSVGYQFGFMLLCFFDFDTFSTQHAQSSAGIPNF